MADRPIPVPWLLLLRRAQYQIVPVATVVACVVLACWLWTRKTYSPLTIGEVNVVRVGVEPKVDGVLLEELETPVKVFDTVKRGQVVARLDLEMVQKQLQRLTAEMESLTASGTSPAAAASQPASFFVAEREAQMAELRTRLAARDIKSPIDGTVMEIFHRPGESSKLGKRIMTIAADKGDFITGYVREDQAIRPTPGMVVTVRTRGANRKSMQSYVASVAPQVEPLPVRHQRNAAVPEWALPVQISIPPEAELRPGEVVDVIFQVK